MNLYITVISTRPSPTPWKIYPCTRPLTAEAYRSILLAPYCVHVALLQLVMCCHRQVHRFWPRAVVQSASPPHVTLQLIPGANGPPLLSDGGQARHWTQTSQTRLVRFSVSHIANVHMKIAC